MKGQNRTECRCPSCRRDPGGDEAEAINRLVFPWPARQKAALRHDAVEGARYGRRWRLQLATGFAPHSAIGWRRKRIFSARSLRQRLPMPWATLSSAPIGAAMPWKTPRTDRSMGLLHDRQSRRRSDSRRLKSLDPPEPGVGRTIVTFNLIGAPAANTLPKAV